MPAAGYNSWRLKHDKRLSLELSILRSQYYQLRQRFALCSDPLKAETKSALQYIVANHLEQTVGITFGGTTNQPSGSV